MADVDWDIRAEFDMSNAVLVRFRLAIDHGVLNVDTTGPWCSGTRARGFLAMAQVGAPEDFDNLGERLFGQWWINEIVQRGIQGVVRAQLSSLVDVVQ